MMASFLIRLVWKLALAQRFGIAEPSKRLRRVITGGFGYAEPELALARLCLTFIALLFTVSTSFVFGDQRGREVSDAAAAVLPSVVVLESVRESSDEVASRSRTQSATGAGVVVTLAGKSCVLTSGHVVGESTSETLRVTTLDRRRLKVAEVRVNNDYDVAVLLLDTANGSLPPSARIGAGGDVGVGDFVIAIGHPFGLRGSVSLGIVSGASRYQIPVGQITMPLSGFIQTDAAINPGNSGGPLVNLRGEVIGIVTAIASTTGTSEGVAMAMPIDVAIYIAEQLASSGRVKRPMIGLELDPAFDDARREAIGMERLIGARVSRVASQSPAAAAGIDVGDIVIACNGRDVENDRHLIHLVAIERPASRVSLRILRDGTVRETEVVLGEQESR
ncbi:MAG: S1C family serine protease [Thermoguttaceae bacterium]